MQQPAQEPRRNAPPGDREHPYRVIELTRRIKETLEDFIGRVWVEGEVSNLRRPQSGHAYFTLKDDQAQLAAVLFKTGAHGLPADLRDGQQVRAFGEISVYERSGNYQLIVRQIEEAGRGSLLQQLEELKRKLEAEGLFDPARKRPLPALPRRIGVVTSPSGAAIRDILNILDRRFPNLQVLVAPVPVQGEGAGPRIANAIEFLNTRGGLDLLIVGRGGGSLEDLWAFNEEVVVRAVAASAIPVISAVGHETDFTLCDFAADLRAPTPSAAAELAVPMQSAVEEQLRAAGRALGRALNTHALGLRNRLTRCAGSYVFREPEHALRRYRERVEVLDKGLRQSLRNRFEQRQQRADDLSLRLARLAARVTDGRRQDLRRLEAQLTALNPTAVLRRGYSITRTERGGVVRRPADVRPGDRIVTALAEGTLRSRVEESMKGDGDGEV